LLPIPPERITQSVALVLTCAILWALLVLRLEPPPPPASDPGVQVSLAEAPPTPAPQPQPEKPKPRVVPVRHAAAAPAPDPMPVQAPPADSPDEPVIATSEPEEAPPPPPSHASIEAAYLAALKKNIQDRTHPPDTAAYRFFRPTGEVLVFFFLDRSGAVSQVTMARSSGSHILDTQALFIVSSGHYPPFPEGAFPGETRHYFQVDVEFPK
jgi:periplasmic protein TonB